MAIAEAYQVVCGVSFYGIDDVLAEIYGDDVPPFDETWDDLCKWLDAHDAAYYARPRDTFSERDALNRAVLTRKSAVVVEDLS